MNIENDEMFAYPLTEEITILFSSANDKWAIETPEDSFSIDEESFEEDIMVNDTNISLEDFIRVKSIIEERIGHEETT